jgi:hypothetical protein
MRSNFKQFNVTVGITAATALATAEFDTLGFGYASIAFYEGTSPTTNGLLTTLTNHALQHSDTAGSGHTAVPGFTAGTDWTPSSAAVATNVAKVIYNVDLRGKKRYLKVTASGNSTYTTGVFVCTLTHPADGRVTAAEIGAGAVVAS